MYESTLYVVRECHVYRVPPRTTAAGYRAAEWGDMSKPLWSGRLRIVETNERCSIRLEDATSGGASLLRRANVQVSCLPHVRTT